MSDLDSALRKAGYVALPLPRKAADPTTIFGFTDGHLYIVRNPHTCLPNPPIDIVEDEAVDLIQFDREFGLEMDGIVGLFTKLLGIGDAKVHLDTKEVRSARVRLGGLTHVTIQTGSMIEYLLGKHNTPCTADLYDKSHLTIIAALRANSFTYKFFNKDNMAIQFALPEVQQLFQAEGGMKVEVLSSGEIAVQAQRYVGVVTWNGTTIEGEVEKFRKPRRRGTTALTAASALERALKPSDVDALRIGSIKTVRSDRRRAMLPGSTRRR
jgi:hypothetical protein